MFNKRLQVEYNIPADIPDRLTYLITKSELVGNKKKKYLNVANVFDLEATSLIVEDEKVGIPYAWNYTLYDDEKQDYIVILGRTISQWVNFCQKLHELLHTRGDLEKRTKYYIPIFIHNLAYDYNFLLKEMSTIPPDSFYAKKNSPIYSRFNNYNIELRCSLMLSGCKLSELPTKLDKLSGDDYDYNKTRLPITPLTDDEVAYIINDGRVLAEYIHNKIIEDGDVSKIPYTKTGYVRNGLKDACFGQGYYRQGKRTDYINSINGLQFNDVMEYMVLKNAYTGGNTSANCSYMGKTLENILAYDITSSYPSVFRSKRFPRKFIRKEKLLNKEQILSLLKEEDIAFAGYFLFENLQAKEHWSTTISLSKCSEIDIENAEYNFNKYVDAVGTNNGKVYQADVLGIYLTNISLEIIIDNYEFDNLEGECIYIYEASYLPRPMVEFMLYVYKKKNELKGVEGREREYIYWKELLNSIYGCCVFDMCKGDIDCDEWGNCENEFDKVDLTDEKVLKQLMYKVMDYNKALVSGKNATPYQFGVWISDLARQNLWKAIRKAGELGIYVYCDTDSIYVLDGLEETDEFNEWIKDYNDKCKEEMIEMCEYFNFDKDCWNKGGHPLGYWDKDGHYKKFKTLGAKRYIMLTDKDEFKITIAGLNKKKGAKYLWETYGNNIWDAFTNDLKVPAEKTGKNTHYIIRHRQEIEATDYLGNSGSFVVNGGVYMEPASFSLSIAEAYIQYLKGFRSDFTEV